MLRPEDGTSFNKKTRDAGPSSNLERAHRQFEAEAIHKNTERRWWEKMLGMKKVSTADIAQGYAERLKEFVEEETAGGKASESEALAKWHLLHSPAIASSSYGYGIDVEAFSEARDLWAKATEGKLSPDAINKWPEVQAQAQREIERKSGGYPYDFKDFIAARNSWTAAGVLSVETANKLPRVQESARTAIERKARGYPYDFKDFLAERNQWVEADVLTQEEANELPMVRESAQTEIQRKARGYPYEFSDFVSTRDQWVSAGVLSVNEANYLPEVQEAAVTDIKRKAQGYPYSKDDLEKTIGNWVGAQVVDDATARAWARRM